MISHIGTCSERAIVGSWEQLELGIRLQMESLAASCCSGGLLLDL
jgi:hypothetical protein